MLYISLKIIFNTIISMNRVAVFCGSSIGYNKIYEEQAYLLGKTLAGKNIGVVYGGGSVGLMGAIANGAVESGGEVIGVLPHFLNKKEIAHNNLTEMILVDTMHERKMKMNELSDGTISLPGGYGTMEEFFEMLTWGQLGLHEKPVAILNTNGFYDSLLELIQKMVDDGFLKEIYRDMLLSSNDIEELLEKMNKYQPIYVEKWIEKETT
jgi:uncharacterized protein (TIGR00730 family)